MQREIEGERGRPTEPHSPVNIYNLHAANGAYAQHFSISALTCPAKPSREENLMKLPTDKTHRICKQKKPNKIQLNLAMFIEFIFHIVATSDSLFSQEDSLKSAWRRSNCDNRIFFAYTGS